MGKYIVSFVSGIFVVAVMLNPLELYAQVNGEPTPEINWLWWLAPLAVLAIGFMVMRYLIKNAPSHGEDDLFSYGLKGGEVKREHEHEASQNDVYVETLRNQERKLREVYNSRDDELEAT